MSGFAIINAEHTLVTYTTRAILALRENKWDKHYSCINCGRCVQRCPAKLNPMYIQKLVQKGRMADLNGYDAHMCTGCGTCSYICPSKLDLAASVEKAREK